MPWIFSLAFPIHIDIYIGSIPHCAKEFQIYTLLIWPYTEISFKIQKTGEPYKSSPVGRSVIIGLGKIQSYQCFASRQQEVFIL